MAKVLVALLRFNPKQEKEILQKVDEQLQVGQLSYLNHLCHFGCVAGERDGGGIDQNRPNSCKKVINQT